MKNSYCIGNGENSQEWKVLKQFYIYLFQLPHLLHVACLISNRKIPRHGRDRVGGFWNPWLHSFFQLSYRAWFQVVINHVSAVTCFICGIEVTLCDVTTYIKLIAYEVSMKFGFYIKRLNFNSRNYLNIRTVFKHNYNMRVTWIL